MTAPRTLAAAALVMLAGLHSPAHAQALSLAGPADRQSAGTMFDVVLSVSGGQAFANALVGVSFDSSKVEFVSAAPGAVLGGFFQPAQSATGAVWAAGSFLVADQRQADGVLARFTFRVVGDGDAAFSVQPKRSLAEPDPGRVALATIGGQLLPLGTTPRVVVPVGVAQPTPVPTVTPVPSPTPRKLNLGSVGGGGVVSFGPQASTVDEAGPPAQPTPNQSAPQPPASVALPSPLTGLTCGTSAVWASLAVAAGMVATAVRRRRARRNGR